MTGETVRLSAVLPATVAACLSFDELYYCDIRPVEVDAAIFIRKTNDKQNKMKRNVKTKLKTYLAAMAALFMPLALSAQTDGFFSSDNGGGNRGVPPKDYPVNNGSGESPIDFEGAIGAGGVATPNVSPIGSGLLIMAAAGAGYLLLKKKEEK